MDKLSKLTEMLGQNFEEYKKDLLKQDKEIVLKRSYETTIKREIAEYYNFNNILSNDIDIISKLLVMNNPLEFLYEEYLRCDAANIINELNVVFEELNI